MDDFEPCSAGIRPAPPATASPTLARALSSHPECAIEVKGLVTGTADFFIAYNEVLYGKNAAPNHRLVMVSVSPDGPEHNQLRYLVDPFRTIDMGGFPATTVQASWPKMWAAGGGPM